MKVKFKIQITVEVEVEVPDETDINDLPDSAFCEATDKAAQQYDAGSWEVADWQEVDAKKLPKTYDPEWIEREHPAIAHWIKIKSGIDPARTQIYSLFTGEAELMFNKHGNPFENPKLLNF